MISFPHIIASYCQFSRRHRKQSSEFVVTRSLLKLFPTEQLFEKLYDTYKNC